MTASLENRVLRCGAVGVGRMGQHHARVYADNPRCEMVGVVDADHDRAGEIGERHSCRTFKSEEALIEAGVDAVSIATPTSSHMRVAKKFLEHGVACLVEKPLALDVSEAQELKDVAERSGAVLMVGHIERFNPVMRAMQRATETGQRVVPRFIEVHRVSPMTFRSVDIGVVMDLMIHDLDVVLWLLDGREPDEIQASGVAVVTPHEDICNARLLWDLPHGKVVANITASRLALKTERVTRITGENAYIKIDFAKKKGTIIRRIANEIQMREVTEQLRRGEDLTSLKWDDLVNIEPLEIDDEEPIVAELEAFMHAVRTGTSPPINADAGLVNVRTAERIVAAVKEFM